MRALPEAPPPQRSRWMGPIGPPKPWFHFQIPNMVFAAALNWLRGDREEVSPSPLPADLLRVQTPAALLHQHAARIAGIRQLVGVPVAHWEALYQPMLKALAAFVQDLPASEAHHHAGPGGLLKHCLDTADRALMIRRGALLPAGASAEEISRLQDVWTYATASAALLHDLGKPLVDQRIQLYDEAGKQLGIWDPLQGPMPSSAYRVEFVRGRRYRLHRKLPPLLVHLLLPEAALRWLANDDDVFEAWLATISGGDSECGGELYRIVTAADGESVGADLTGGPIRRLATAKALPLAERLATGLRYLIDSGELPLNRPGAGGWVTNGDLWLVSKRVLDALRDYLLGQGQVGIPSGNDRLMDELQQHRLLQANGDRAIWMAQVSTGDWSCELSLLRVPLVRLWSTPDGRPPAFNGTVTPLAAAAGASSPSMTAPASIATVLEPMDSPASAAVVPPSASPVTASGDEVTDEGAESSLISNGLLQKSDFLQWVVDGIRSGRLKTNAVDARIHFVNEGMLLVSPGIFRDFAGLEWDCAQKRFLRLKQHLKRPDGTNIWTYRVLGENRIRGLLKGIILPAPEGTIGIQPPRINPHLQLESQPKNAALSAENSS